jgi:hypothetical protein
MQKAHKEVAQNLLRMKMSADDVAKATGLPLGEVERLAAVLPGDPPPA